jgi:predicted CoA-binding protein
MNDACEFPTRNAPSAAIDQLLATTKTIAVVGLSDNPGRASHHVAGYMQQQGYRIIPVNPSVQEVLGEKSYASLHEIPEPVDMVDVFRKPDAVPAIVADAIAIKAKSVWLQEGIVHNEAAAQAEAAGLTVVQNKCLLKEHARRRSS